MWDGQGRLRWMVFRATRVVVEALGAYDPSGASTYEANGDAYASRIEALEPRTLVPGHGRILRGSEIGHEVARVRACLEAALAG